MLTFFIAIKLKAWHTCSTQTAEEGAGAPPKEVGGRGGGWLGERNQVCSVTKCDPGWTPVFVRLMKKSRRKVYRMVEDGGTDGKGDKKQKI